MPSIAETSSMAVMFAATILAAFPVYGQTPDAGAVIKSLPTQQSKPQSAPQIEDRIRKAKPIADVDGLAIEIKRFNLTGLTVIAADDARRVLEPYLGRGKRFQDLLDAAAELKKLMAARGYFLAEVIVPEQKLKDGEVELMVLEGRLGKIKLEVASDVPLSKNYLESFLKDLQPGSIVQTSILERALFLMSDLKGISMRTVFEPGDKVGTTDLVVTVTRGSRMDASLDFDANGSIYTGVYRGGAGVDLNSPLGLGDLLSIRYVQSADTLEYKRITYLLPLGSSGFKVGFAKSDLEYRLTTRVFDPLKAHGTADVDTLIAAYPFIRSRNLNLIATAQFDRRQFDDIQAAVNQRTKKETQVGSVGLGGDLRDGLLGGGINVFNVTHLSGRLRFGDKNSFDADQNGHRTNGAYSKLNLSYSRLQSIMDGIGFYFSYQEQLASKNLDSSEKFSLGGPQGVRAYPTGEGAGDEGRIFTGELRFRVPSSEYIPGNMVATAFFDSGMSRLFKSPIALDLATKRYVYGVGVGLNWEKPGSWTLRASLATPVKDDAPTSEHTYPDPRLFLQFSKFF